MAKPVIAVAKESAASEGGASIRLPDGQMARIVPVSMSLIDAVTSRLVEPQPPKVLIEEKGREEPNPNDPSFLQALEEFNRARGIAVVDAMVMFGLELSQGVPEDTTWLKKLRYMERRDIIDLSDYDLEDDLDVEFVYKRYIVAAPYVVQAISEASGISQEEVEQAEGTFPSN